jgi:hypothetical protein
VSVRTYTIKSISCDLRISKECEEEFEGLPGVIATEVRQHALENGWRRAKSALSRGLKDVCPKCLELVAGKRYVVRTELGSWVTATTLSVDGRRGEWRRIPHSEDRANALVMTSAEAADYLERIKTIMGAGWLDRLELVEVSS